MFRFRRSLNESVLWTYWNGSRDFGNRAIEISFENVIDLPGRMKAHNFGVYIVGLSGVAVATYSWGNFEEIALEDDAYLRRRFFVASTIDNESR
jgi:hypothetical protein